MLTELLQPLAEAIHGSAISQTLRASIWLYPLVNTGHVVGIALLFGGIAPLDLRLLGWRRGVALDQLVHILVPTAVVGMLLAVTTGSLLFITRPLDYIIEPLFGIKLVLLGLAICNALVLRRSAHWRLLGVAADVPIQPGWRFAAAASLLLWLGVIAAGRLIGYR